MELGHSIHLPFQDPLIDVYDADAEDGKAILFAHHLKRLRNW